MGELLERLLPYLLEGGVVMLITRLWTLKETKRKAVLDADNDEIDNMSKIINEYKVYIDTLKKDREEAIKERDYYKDLYNKLWEELNEVKRRMAVIDGQLSVSQMKNIEYELKSLKQDKQD